MELKRLRTTAVLACGGGLIALALTGCNINGNASVSSNSPQSTSSDSPTSASSTGGSVKHAGGSVKNSGGSGVNLTSTGQTDTPRCMAAELHADLQVQNSNSEEKGIGTLILTNRSNHSCLIPAGWAPIGTGGPNYAPLSATRVNYPGRGMNITLRPGNSAFAGMKWHTGTSCGTTSGIGVVWNSSWIPVTYLDLNGRKPAICDYLVLGTMQPTMNGVNFT